MHLHVALAGQIERRLVAPFEHVLADQRPPGVDLAVEVDHVADPQRTDVVFSKRNGKPVRGHGASSLRYSTPSRREYAENQDGTERGSIRPSMCTRTMPRREAWQSWWMPSGVSALWV